jgi:hypothetical protein
MSREDEYDSVADRQKAAQARVHTELTDPCRERIAQITLNPVRLRLSSIHGRGGIPNHLIEQAVTKTYEDVGFSIKEHAFPNNGDTITSHKNIILNSDTLDVLSYVENLLEFTYHTGRGDWRDISIPRKQSRSETMDAVKSRIEQSSEKINTALETEGVLWRLEQNDDSFDFKPVGSELMQEADNELAVLAQGKTWESVISPYNTAYNLYRDRTYGREIPEKLYNSIEELARVICVDLEGWENDRGQNLSIYLDRMREEGVFEPNNIMSEELEDLTKSMERAFQKAGAERKNRHKEMDREYCTLLLHQVSAYLTFIIRNYEGKYGDD